jgi:hypothetical protein
MLVPDFQTEARLGLWYLAKEQLRLSHIVRRREPPHCLIPMDSRSSYRDVQGVGSHPDASACFLKCVLVWKG